MLLETVAISAGTFIVLEKAVDALEPLRNFFRGQTMIQSSEMSIEVLRGNIADEVSRGFHEIQAIQANRAQTQQSSQQQAV